MNYKLNAITTLEIYIHVTDQMAKNMMNKLEKVSDFI